ncbi:MAG TPA: GNAT family N-acetyltransferase, partial [Blastocatellia bacterium]|nr:GNAT family N-acetyltransferase [Blastocatellia bacterium]
MKSKMGQEKLAEAYGPRCSPEPGGAKAIPLQLHIRVRKLVAGEEALAFEYLNQHPLENLTLIGFIRDHGLVSERNRGSFYGYFCEGRLSGMALIGHHTLLSCEANAAQYFGHIAVQSYREKVTNLMGSNEAVAAFRQCFNEMTAGRQILTEEKESLYVARQFNSQGAEIRGLRQVQAEELEEVSVMHARTYLEWNGVDPSAKDPAGFRERMLARIEKGRIWIVRDERGIAFKTDIVSESPEAVYLEGVWTREDLRENGFGSAALKQLGKTLLQQYPAICLYASAEDKRAPTFYEKVGFQVLCVSDL